MWLGRDSGHWLILQSLRLFDDALGKWGCHGVMDGWRSYRGAVVVIAAYWAGRRIWRPVVMEMLSERKSLLCAEVYVLIAGWRR